MAKTRKQAENEVETLYNSIIETGELFPGGDRTEKEANAIITEMNDARASGDAKLFVKAMMLKDKLKTCIIRMVYVDDDASDIPIAYLKHCQTYPVRGGVFATVDQRKAIKNPNKAIRTFCLECQGQDTVGVRQCPASTCILWAFRMGGNPFFGRLNGAEDEAVDTAEEEAAMEASRLQTPDEERAHANTEA